jgi:hypothetical protein
MPIKPEITAAHSTEEASIFAEACSPHHRSWSDGTLPAAPRPPSATELCRVASVGVSCASSGNR